MENDILDGLRDTGYEGPLKDKKCLEEAISNGLKHADYRELVVWLCSQVQNLAHLDEKVNAIDNPDDISTFLMEISSLLKELGCPYSELIEGHITDRLTTKYHRLLLLDYLIGELLAARMNHINSAKVNGSFQLKLLESSTANDLKRMLIALDFSKPPENISAAVLFDKVEKKISEVLTSTKGKLPGKSLLNGTLSGQQWDKLAEIHRELQGEYRVRREMLLTRLDVTIQSFQWSEKAKSKEDIIADGFVRQRDQLTTEPGVHLADVLAARSDLAVIEKTSSAKARQNTKSQVHKVIIGRVPDRGGRPSEQEAPPPEMPSWQKDRAQAHSQPSGGGNFSRGGGGRVQGGWNQQQQQYHSDHRGGDHQQVKDDNYRDYYQHDNRGSGGSYRNENQGGRGGGRYRGRGGGGRR